MFDALSMAPPDAIMGLSDAFKKDPNPKKINLTIGVYKDAQGNTPVFRSVKRAEEKLLKEETTKSYIGIPGAPEYGEAVQRLLFGDGHGIVGEKRAATAHTPGGTGALRVAADFLKQVAPSPRIWMSDPTWANHGSVFRAAGLEVKSYPYYDAARHSLAFNRMIEGLGAIPEGDIILFHACCHNPTGVDPTPEQWERISAVVAERRLLPLVDFAYQGLGEGMEEDCTGLYALCRAGGDLLVASSFSKNFGLYRERVGALTVVGASADAAQRAFSHVKTCIRANYSNPPAHGAAIVVAILADAKLRADWLVEVDEMRGRIQQVREQFVQKLQAQGVRQDFAFIMHQKGMFSFSGLTRDQVIALREKYAIYIVESGRINVAGINAGNVDTLCAAIAEVLGAKAA